MNLNRYLIGLEYGIGCTYMNLVSDSIYLVYSSTYSQDWNDSAVHM